MSENIEHKAQMMQMITVHAYATFHWCKNGCKNYQRYSDCFENRQSLYMFLSAYKKLLTFMKSMIFCVFFVKKVQ